jgi:16S rRNA (guanine527-N7)-methyltransferase
VTSRDFQERLARRARHAGVAIPGSVAERLETYFRLLATWNEKINLTALPLSDPAPGTIDRLLIEPLVAAAHVPRTARRMLDVGSGGGSPAVPMLLALPRMHLRMVESKTRKSVFLREVVRSLELLGDVITARFEELLTRPDFHEAHDLITVRAVRLEPRLLSTLQAFLKPGGALFLFRASGASASDIVVPPLSWTATYPLVDASRSRLVVLNKRPTAAQVAP